MATPTKGPLPRPKDMTFSKMLDVPFSDPRCRPVVGMVCRTCGGPALMNPFTNKVWGCGKCRVKTMLPRNHFREV